MNVKKSTIIVVSAVSAILVWLSYQQGVNYGLKKKLDRTPKICYTRSVNSDTGFLCIAEPVSKMRNTITVSY